MNQSSTPTDNIRTLQNTIPNGIGSAQTTAVPEQFRDRLPGDPTDGLKFISECIADGPTDVPENNPHEATEGIPSAKKMGRRKGVEHSR